VAAVVVVGAQEQPPARRAHGVRRPLAAGLPALAGLKARYLPGDRDVARMLPMQDIEHIRRDAAFLGGSAARAHRGGAPVACCWTGLAGARRLTLWGFSGILRTD